MVKKKENMDVLKAHFEQEDVWHKDKYLCDEQEQIRFKATLNLIQVEVKSLIDIGTGNGAFLWHLEQSDFSGTIEGLEYSQAGIRNKLCNATIRQGTIQEINAEEKSYDMVTCLEVIEHLPVNIFREGLLEMERIAKKYIIISVPHKEHRVNVICPYCKCEFNPNTHVRSFDKHNMENLFGDFKLNMLLEVGTKKQFFMSCFQNELRRIFARKSFPENLTCPQCNYKKQWGNNNHLNAGEDIRPKNNQKEKMIKRLFFIKKPKWYIGLYIRNEA